MSDAMASGGEAYDSLNDDSADEIFNSPAFDRNTVATLPLSNVQKRTSTDRSPSQQAATLFTTQPTQPLHTPRRPGLSDNPAPDASSPSVQVAASSPIKSAQSPTPQKPPSGHGASQGRVHPMAPPGTQFRPPSAWPSTAQTQTQTQTMDSDGDEESSNSSDNGRSADIRPSVFSKGSRSSGPGRIQDSPQSGFNSAISRFSYVSPSKRPASDDIASAHGPQTKAPRQTGPAKAQAVAQDMTLDDIDDFNMRQKARNIISILPTFSVARVHHVLIKERGSYDQALEYLQREATRQDSKASRPAIDLTASDDELSSAPKQTAKRTVTKAASIASKWSSTQDPKQASKQSLAPNRPIAEKWASSEARDSSPAKPRKRLTRPGGGRTVQDHPQSSPQASPAKAPVPRKSRYVDSEEEDSGVGEEEASDEGNDGLTSTTRTKLLDFVNTSSELALRDLSGQPENVVAKVVADRPYQSLDDVTRVQIETTTTTKKGNKRTSKKLVGERFHAACIEMWNGYEAIDKLVAECGKLGEPIAAQMRLWGLDTFGSANQGEMEMTNLASSASAHDSGIGTPTSSASHDDDDNVSKLQPQRMVKKPVLGQPKVMSSQLVMKDYQIAGLNWLALLYKHGLSAILADDMGLGKTCQVIAFLAHLKEQGIATGVHLVVVPGSTLENWLREFKNFCPAMRAEPYYGGINERPSMQVKIEAEIEEIDVIVTTYDLAAKPADAKFLRTLKPVVCVFDEAHVLRNSLTERYRNLMKIPAQQMRLLLTGTPLQNNLNELGSMLGFLMPAVFREYGNDLQHIFKQRAKVQTSKDDTTSNSQHDALLSKDRVARARSMLTPFILRRKKQQVLKQLPKKTNVVEYCSLEGEHREIYEGALSRFSGLMAQSSQETGKASKAHKANTLMDLRKAALHPLMFRRFYDDKKVKKIARRHVQEYPDDKTAKNVHEKKVIEWLSGLSDYEIHREIFTTMPELSEFQLEGEPWMESSKVKSLLEILDKHSEDGHTTLIFSQFTTVMNILEAVFETKSVPFYRLDGQTNMNQRQDLIDDFTRASGRSEGRKPVFMLSTRAGGQGINLACANRVIIFDSGYNPQDDVQAENRAHRVGQTREVEVMRLIAKGTIEEDILTLGQRKVKLDEMVAGAGDDSRAEEEGESLVERMLSERLKSKAHTEENGVKDEEQVKEAPKEPKDIGEDYMSGLKKAGLNMSAAARRPIKG